MKLCRRQLGKDLQIEITCEYPDRISQANASSSIRACVQHASVSVDNPCHNSERPYNQNTLKKLSCQTHHSHSKTLSILQKEAHHQEHDQLRNQRRYHLLESFLLLVEYYILVTRVWC